MKLNAQTTALGLLNDNAVHQITLSEKSTELHFAMDFFNNEFNNMLPLFRQQIRFISSPFLNAFLKTYKKFLEILLLEPIKQSGTFIFSNASQRTLTAFYDLETKCSGANLIVNGRLIMFTKSKEDQHPYLVFYSHVVDSDARSYLRPKEIIEGYTANDQINMIMGLILFIKYCEVETKLIPAGKETTHRLQRYVNHTTQPIEILDATWFTTLVRSGAFTVGQDTGGFFRWQAVGAERSERKLIWISPYQKQGYTRKAKVLNHRPDPPS